VESGHASPGRLDRGSRAPSRLRAPADPLPCRRAGAAAVGSPDRPRPPGSHCVAGHGLLRGDHVRVHRSGQRRALPRRRCACGPGEPTIREVRSDAAQPAAWPR
jgi:hypothetical protein